MEAGKLKEIIKVYKPEITRNSFNEQDTEYKYAFTTKAEVIYKSGTRQEGEGDVFYQYIRKFNVRIYNDINELDHIEWNGKMYRILNIDDNKIKQAKYIETEIIHE